MASKTKKTDSMPSLKKTAAKPRMTANEKVRARAKTAPAKTPPAKASRVLRRDGAGHLDPQYAADLHAKSLASAQNHTVDRAFLRHSRTLRVPLAEELGREAVMTMTSAEDQSDQLQNVKLRLGEEIGGPFVPTTAGQEFARGSDRSNPRGATREPFPKT